MTPVYLTLDVQITLRCNLRCRNCIKLCGAEDVTGMPYGEETDMTEGQFAKVLADARRVSNELGRPAVGTFCITGGEPLLHPRVRAFAEAAHTLESEGVVERVTVNTNGVLEMAGLNGRAVTYTRPAQKAAVHNVVLLHPSELAAPRGFAVCTHYRKWRPVVNVFGYSMCCAGDGYIRLYRLWDLLVADLPREEGGFPLERMDAVCVNCPFGCAREVFERDAGRPVSAAYREQGQINARLGYATGAPRLAEVAA